MVYLQKAVVLLLLWGIGPEMLAAKTSPWKQYQSANFLLYSDRKAAEARHLLRQFERFRYAALEITGGDHTPAEEPTTVYLFRHKQDYQALQPNNDIAGFYREGWSGPEMVVAADTRLRDVSLILFHEYVHFLMRTRSPMAYPIWYDEGFADLLAASYVSEDHVVIGAVHPWRQKTLSAQDMLPLEQMLGLGADDAELDARFYASAWLFMHYLQLAHLSGDTNRHAALAGFVQALDKNTAPQVAFAQHFGFSLAQAQKKLQAYSERRQWNGYRLAVPNLDFTLRERALSANETAYVLGGLAYRAGQAQAALSFLQRIDAGHKSAAPALSLRAVIDGHMGRSELAEHVLALALRFDSAHSGVLTNAAHLHWDLAQTQSLTAVKQKEHLRKARGYARAALRLDGRNVSAARYLAAVYKSEGRVEQAIELLTEQHRFRRSDPRLNLTLGAYLVEAGQAHRAQSHLRRVMQDHSAARRKKAQALLSAIDTSDAPASSDSGKNPASPIRLAPEH